MPTIAIMCVNVTQYTAMSLTPVMSAAFLMRMTLLNRMQNLRKIDVNNNTLPSEPWIQQKESEKYSLLNLYSI